MEIETSGQRDDTNRPIVVKKKVISVDSVADLKKTLRVVDYKREFVTVHPLSVEVARWCAHDSRIDSVLLSVDNLYVFDKRQLSVLKHYSKPIEVAIPDIISEHGVRDVFYRKISFYLSRKVALILSSRAREWFETYHPFSLAKILSTQYDIPSKIVLLALSDVPRMILSSKEVFST